MAPGTRGRGGAGASAGERGSGEGEEAEGASSRSGHSPRRWELGLESPAPREGKPLWERTVGLRLIPPVAERTWGAKGREEGVCLDHRSLPLLRANEPSP